MKTSKTNVLLLIMLVISTLTSNMSNAQAFLDVSIGQMRGYNKEDINTVRVPHPVYELYKSEYGNVKAVSGMVNMTGGYMFKNNITISAGMIRAFDNIQPTFLNTTIGYNFINRESEKLIAVGVYPYAGITYHIDNYDNREMGVNAVIGTQLQTWILTPKNWNLILFADYKYQYKHHVYGVGMRFSSKL